MQEAYGHRGKIGGEHGDIVSNRKIAFVLAIILMLPLVGKARDVAHVRLEKVGLNLDAGDKNLTEGCKDFRPTTNQVNRYFSKAYPVESYVLTTTRYSPCYATGTVKFTDGSSGRFQLYSGGAATLFWSRGIPLTCYTSVATGMTPLHACMDLTRNGSARAMRRYAAFTVLCMALSVCHARGVQKVTLEQIGQALDDDDPMVIEACRKFRPSAGQIKIFFSRAYPVEQRYIMHDHYSPCYARGTVLFTDGSGGEWILYSGGTASLVWRLGQDKVNLFYGRNKWHDPFACTYGMESDDKC